MLIVANWKAYVSDLKKARALARAAERASDTDRRIVLAPTAPLFSYLRDRTKAPVTFALQDISDTEAGAATGEITAHIAQSLGAVYVIIGHSERRARGESDAIVVRKAQAALATGLMPILCIGEQMRDPDAEYLSAVRSQLDAVLAILTPEQRTRLVIAYEPVWAIGKSAQDAMKPSDLLEMVRYLRKCLEAYMASTDAAQIPVLYGGSVDPTNVQALVEGTGVQGLLVGRASTEPTVFSALIRALK